jgi:3'(2'),5'-bisphosphate nucleotidase
MTDYLLSPSIDDSRLHAFCALAEEAGAILMRYWRGTHDITLKADESPVTQADIEADRLITEGLKRLWPDVPLVSEEGSGRSVDAAAPFLLVDPLDGTKGFIRGGRNFTVNIALIEHTRPVLGVVFVPAQDVMYAGGRAYGAWRILRGRPAEAINTREAPEEGPHAILSHQHIPPETENFLRSVSVNERSSAASSIKFCKVAEGTADMYPRFGRTMEWDTAAGQAVLEAAGGRVTTMTGEPFLYGKPDFVNGDFIAWGR